MNRILVIGASSFSGGHFCKFLEAKGMEVVRASLRMWSLPLRPNLPELIVNFSALNVVAPSWDWPQQYMNANVDRIIDLLEFMHSGYGPAVKKYVHISTPEVYGSVQHEISEEISLKPSTPYAVSRAAAEMMCEAYGKQYGLPICFTRSCNVYGPGQQLYRMIPKLIVSIRKGIPFPLEGGGKSLRAFIHIDDLCRAIWRVLIDGQPPLAYNISSQYLFQIRELAALVCSRMGVRMQDVIQIAPDRPGKDASYHLDISRMLALGWVDEITIEEGIDQMIKWVDDNWTALKDQPLEYQIKL